ncbi:stalk domain-containing protein [Collibacillus ludicampi]
MVPLRSIAEALGANVIWDPKTKTGTAQNIK